MSPHLRWSLTPLLLALNLVLVPAAASASADEAEPSVDLSLRPVDHPGSYFDLTMEPGESQELKIAHSNNGDAALDVRIFPADAYTLVNGGFGAMEAGSETGGTTTWLDYAAQELAMPPGYTGETSLTVSVPRETAPGQYITSLVLQNAEPLEGSGDVALNQTVRQALPITIEVPGELEPGFELGKASHEFTASRSVIDLDLMNTGNAHVEPEGDFVIRDDAGETVSETELTMGSVFAGTQTTAEVTLDGALQPGDYPISGSMTDAESGLSASADQTFSVEVTEDSPAGNAEAGTADLPGINQAAPPGSLIYLLGGAVLILVGLIVYLLLHGRRAGRPR